jgi:hypothetical protein
MSSTRYAPEGSPLRQEKFSSSEAFKPGLLAHLVANRCAQLESAEDRATIIWLQSLSWSEGRIGGVAAGILKHYRNRLGTASMRGIVNGPEVMLDAKKVQAIRKEMPGAEDWFLTYGEFSSDEHRLIDLARSCHQPRRVGEISEMAKTRPKTISSDCFFEACEEAAAADDGLSKFLAELCLNPETDPAIGPWYFAQLPDVLREFKALCQNEARKGVAITSAGQMIYDAIAETGRERLFTMIHGEPGRGKSFAARACCAGSAGAFRYFVTPASNDDHSFFLGLAKVLGLPANLKSKAFELRERIEQALVSGEITLVIDESARLWPMTNIRDRMPGRISWIIQMADLGVPIVLIVTPHFFDTKHRIEKATGWNTEQLMRRFRRVVDVPTTIPREDIEAVCESLLPEATEELRGQIVDSLKGTAEPLDNLDSIARRAAGLAGTRSPNAIEIARSALRVDAERKVLDRLAPLKTRGGSPLLRSNTEDTASAEASLATRAPGAKRTRSLRAGHSTARATAPALPSAA